MQHQKHELFSAAAAVFYILPGYLTQRGFYKARGKQKCILKVRVLRLILHFRNIHAAGTITSNYDAAFKCWYPKLTG